MSKIIKPALIFFALFAIMTGLLYPLLITGIAQAVFPYQANGSIIRTKDGDAAGSVLIGQPFSDPKYFWGRLSATSGEPYNASASGGSNYSVLNPALQDEVRQRVAALRSVDPGNTLPIPVDLVTSSGSGLDPHISPAAAYYQAGRIARIRNLSLDQVNKLVDQYTEKPFLGFIGEARVNVLLLNLALDSL